MGLQEQIELQVAAVLLEVRTGFKLEKLKSFASEQDVPDMWIQEDRVKYAAEHLKRLGRGGSRVVYLLSNRFVLKMADPGNYRFGKEQNQTEVEVYTNPKVAPIVAKVYDTDSDFNWIISELVRPLLSGDEFEKLTGLKFSKLSNIIDGMSFTQVRSVEDAKNNALDSIARYERDLEAIKTIEPGRQKAAREEVMMYIGLYQEMLKNLEHPIVVATLNLMNEGNLVGADLKRVEHWGKTADGRVVLLDYGYTESVIYRYY